jgi:hypothetical protein
MAGLVSAIHAAGPNHVYQLGAGGNTWMPGPSPGMTVLLRSDYSETGPFQTVMPYVLAYAIEKIVKLGFCKV